MWFLIPVRGYGFSQIWRGNNVTSTSANIIQFQSYTLHRVLQLSSKLSLTTHWDILLGGITRSGSIFKLELILKWILSLHQVHMKHYCMHINWSRWDKQTGSNFLGPRSRWKKIIACLTIKLAAGFADPRRNLVDPPQSLKSTTKQPAVGGPKSLETKKLGSLKGWEDQSAEKTNKIKNKTKYTLLSLVEFVEIYALFGRTKQTKNLRWEDQTGF